MCVFIMLAWSLLRSKFVTILIFLKFLECTSCKPATRCATCKGQKNKHFYWQLSMIAWQSFHSSTATHMRCSSNVLHDSLDCCYWSVYKHTTIVVISKFWPIEILSEEPVKRCLTRLSCQSQLNCPIRLSYLTRFPFLVRLSFLTCLRSLLSLRCFTLLIYLSRLRRIRNCFKGDHSA